jgi:hypothetical protein
LSVYTQSMLWQHISLLCRRVVHSSRPWTARLHNWLICRHNIDCVYTNEHRKTIFVFLAKHRTAPWWWFLREPKHVGANVIVLSVLTFLRFYNSVHQLEQ